MDENYLSVEQVQDLLKGPNVDFVSPKVLFPDSIGSLIAYVSTKEAVESLGYSIDRMACWHLRVPEGGKTYVFIGQMAKTSDGVEKMTSDWATYPTLFDLQQAIKSFSTMASLQPQAHESLVYQLGA